MVRATRGSELWPLVALWSVLAWMFTIPVGVVFGWLWLPVLTPAVITVLCLLGLTIAESRSLTFLAGVIGWLLGVAVGVGLIVFGVKAIRDFEPSCVPSESVDCRWVSGTGSDWGEASVSEQKEDLTVDTVLYLIVPGSALLIGLAWAGISFLRSR